MKKIERVKQILEEARGYIGAEDEDTDKLVGLIMELGVIVYAYHEEAQLPLSQVLAIVEECSVKVLENNGAISETNCIQKNEFIERLRNH
jgi:NAD-specific glutamate dehydrogenase